METKKQRNKQATKTRSIHRRSYEKLFESDGTYFLKLVLFTLLGTFWLKFALPISWGGLLFNGVPVGLLLGLLLVRQFEKYQSDRKIWYAILLVVAIISYFFPSGLVI